MSGIVLGDNRYGKAETRVVRVERSGSAHEIKDLNVSIALAGDFAAVHLTGDNANVVPTDTQKNTVYAFARDGIGEIEDFGLRLAQHFVREFKPVHSARVTIDEYAWRRLHEHAFERAGAERRTCQVTANRDRAWVVGGISDLVLLKTTDSEFYGFIKDRYTTLAETSDRIMATSVVARWRFRDAHAGWKHCFETITGCLKQTFAAHHSLSLQQTLYAMGETVLTQVPDVVEVRMSMPNKHHFLVDLAPFSLTNENQVYYAADRPYGLIEGTVLRENGPEPGQAW